MERTHSKNLVNDMMVSGESRTGWGAFTHVVHSRILYGSDMLSHEEKPVGKPVESMWEAQCDTAEITVWHYTNFLLGKGLGNL